MQQYMFKALVPLKWEHTYDSNKQKKAWLLFPSFWYICVLGQGPQSHCFSVSVFVVWEL